MRERAVSRLVHTEIYRLFLSGPNISVEKGWVINET